MKENDQHASHVQNSGVQFSNAIAWRPLLGLMLVLVVAALIFFTNLGQAQLWDRDEPRNAGCALEMMQRNDLIVPIFNGELRYQKPVLLYWLIMSAYEMFGVNEFAARFWSALLAVGTVGITFSIAMRMFGLHVALFSGVILATNVMFTVAARAATPDSTLIFFSTLTIACFVWGSSAKIKKRITSDLSEDGAIGRLARSFDELSFPWLILMGVSMGLAMLAKGPIGFLMPMAIMGMHLLIVRRRRPDEEVVQGKKKFSFFEQFLAVVNPIHFFQTAMSMRPFFLLAIALLIAAPWYVWVGINTEYDFLRIFFVDEHLGRSTTVLENHSGGLWYYPVAILLGFFPWSLFWLPVAIVLYRGRSLWDDGTILAICWVGVQVTLFSIAQTKLPSYVTPCYPALSILTAVGLQFWLQKTVPLSDRWMYAVMIVAIITGLLLSLAATAFLRDFLPDEYWMPLVGVPLIIGGLMGVHKLNQSENQAALLRFAVGSATFVFLLFGFGTGRLSALQNNRRILDPISQLPPEVAVASYQSLESTWPFYSRRTIYETNPRVVAQSVDREKFWRPKPKTTPESFAQQHKECVFITTDDHAEDLMERLPVGFAVIEDSGLSF